MPLGRQHRINANNRAGVVAVGRIRVPFGSGCCSLKRHYSFILWKLQSRNIKQTTVIIDFELTFAGVPIPLLLVSRRKWCRFHLHAHNTNCLLYSFEFASRKQMHWLSIDLCRKRKQTVIATTYLILKPSTLFLVARHFMFVLSLFSTFLGRAGLVRTSLDLFIPSASINESN